MIRHCFKMLAAQFEFSEAYCHAETKEYDNHKDEVNCLAFSPDLEMMVTGGDEGRVRIFNRVKGQFVARLVGHKGAIKSVAVSSDSRLIASASMDGHIHIWRTCDAELLLKLTGHASGVETVSFTHDALYLCSGGWDCTAIIWNLKTGSAQTILTGHQNGILCCAFSSGDSCLLATGSWDHDVRLWTHGGSKEAGKCQTLSGHQAAVTAVVFSKQGMLASGSHDKTILLWNPRSGTMIRRLVGHTGWVQALAFNFAGTVLSSVSDDETCKLWDVVTGECAKTMEIDQSIGQVHCVVFGSDDRLVVGGSNSLRDRRKRESPQKDSDDIT